MPFLNREYDNVEVLIEFGRIKLIVPIDSVSEDGSYLNYNGEKNNDVE